MDSLCEAFQNLRLTKKLDTFTCFPKLPPELQLMIWEAAIEEEPVVHNIVWLFRRMKRPVIPEICSGINWLSHYKAKKVYKRFTLRIDRPSLFFNVGYDSVLFENLMSLCFSAVLLREELVTSVQGSARICERRRPSLTRSPLYDIDEYLQLESRIQFPFSNLRTFIIQDLQCSRKHRLQEINKRVKCKKAMEQYFADQHTRYQCKIPEILIRVPQMGNILCYECKQLDKWWAMDQSERRAASRVHIIDPVTTIPSQYLRSSSNLLPWHVSNSSS
ncbi:hypothetical protein MFRU_028g00240 [Monilinia fructicola]|nr:hypothetical protein MFRU_028g00240 [Monilinia fructicola]